MGHVVKKESRARQVLKWIDAQGIVNICISNWISLDLGAREAASENLILHTKTRGMSMSVSLM